MAVSAILQGENPKESEIPPFVSEFFLASEFGWKIEYIQSMPWKYVDMLTTLVSVKYKLIAQGRDVWSQGFAKCMR